MKIYLVGGAVRDKLLGLPHKEKDWVVVGATVSEMLQQGFKQVGKDFPVFLHPQTKEEYALARVERKVGLGYTGFTFDTSTQVTLEDDLRRRDLTINAMAETETGDLIDPYGGQNDLQQKILRHVSAAFLEDPVRILRVARFAARFAFLGFTVAPETLALMRTMVKNGEVDALVAERVWKELERALLEKNPENFFAVLENCGALPILFPAEIHRDALMRAVKLSENASVRFAALCSKNSAAQIKALCDRYRVPSEYRDLAVLVARYFLTYKDVNKLAPVALFKLMQDVDAFRREDRFYQFLIGSDACSQVSNADFLKQCFIAAKKVNTKVLTETGLKGPEIADKIAEERIKAIKTFLEK